MKILSRRGLLAGGLAAAGLPFVDHGALAEVPACGPNNPPMTPKPQRAVSLRRLSEMLANSVPGSSDCADANRLCGLTRIDGYVLDRPTRDIVLWGLVEAGARPLALDDLLVGLRISHGIYGEKRGNTILITEPAISIDPAPDVLRALSQFEMTPGPDEGVRTRQKQQWEELCQTAQRVRVEGLPRDCRATKILVECDYAMKAVTQRRHVLPLDPPIISMLERPWRDQKERAKRGDRRQAPSFMTRFWFEPGRFTYQYSAQDNVVFIDRAEVALHDEAQSMLASGNLQGSGKLDPLSRSFACEWTTRMAEVERAEPAPWKDMHNVFRAFACANIIAARRAFQQTGLDADLLLHRLPIATVPVRRGTSRVGRGLRCAPQRPCVR